MLQTYQEFLNRCLLFDIETNENGEIYALGAFFNGKIFNTPQGRKVGREQFAEFDNFGRSAEFVLGHNILSHDIPRLREKDSTLAILHKQVVDTLHLSPLAFPENPYHRLVKNYQIVRDGINNPAEDAVLAGKVFIEQWEAFSQLLTSGSDAPLIYRGFFAEDKEFAGIAAALGAMGVPLLAGDDLYETFSRLIQKDVCREALERVVAQLLDKRLEHPPLAYVTAWLIVSGGNSVLPPWVRHHFPVVPSLLHQLRDQPCRNPGCSYCKINHNPRFFLQNYFGFEDFRPEPATDDGRSLQETIVSAAARNSSLFATLPTGGGKTLCYLLPALMRYRRRNTLTIVISPLQALMKDQVENFARQTGTTLAATINGMLSLPERGEVMDGVRLGDVGILYVSPEQGLLSKETVLSAYVRYKVKDSSEKRLKRFCLVERDFLTILQETAPDADAEKNLVIDLRQVNQQLIDMGHSYSTPGSLGLVLRGISRDGKGLAGQKGSVSIKSRGNNSFSIILHRDWESLQKTVAIRQQAAHVALEVIQASLRGKAQVNASLLVKFTLEGIVAGLKKDLILFSELRDPLAAAERGLTFMHEQGVIVLQQGLAVFRQAMTITINPEARGKQYTKANFEPLKIHYSEKNFQVHVINEYARCAIEKVSVAMSLVHSYFNDEKEEFVQRFFPGKEELLERATSEQSYQRIVEDLNNRAQEIIVGAPTETNMLIMAGSGAGKTRTVAHRVAYLLRVKRVRPQAILILCFNRSAAIGLRRRLRDMVGRDMAQVTTLTFHGLALRLTGRSLIGQTGGTVREEIDFSRVIQDAIALLKGECDVLGFADGQPRDALMSRFSHILVDEYQDIDEEQYELVSLLAGRALTEKDEKLTILAVGDDDQNIYRFRGANVDFIRRFKADYQADVHYLTENYRSTANIIKAANALIVHNRDRMKTEHPIVINRARETLPPGGNWQLSDQIGQGKVQCFQVEDTTIQALVLLEELQRLQSLSSDFDLNSCAILAREWQELDIVRGVLEAEGIPVSLNWGRSAFPGLTRIRENDELLSFLHNCDREQVTARTLLDLLPEKGAGENIWQANLRTLIQEWSDETGNTPQPVGRVENYFYEALADQHRGRNLENGIFLSTVHSIKGLEFDHVFVPDGNWQQKTGQEMEEERRLYYVAMSRARETLQLFALNNAHNPHIELLDGDFLLSRQVAPSHNLPHQVPHYELLGMKDLYIDFAGRKKENHPTSRAIKELTTGSRLTISHENSFLHLLNHDGIPVARLSKTARRRWQDRLTRIFHRSVNF